MAKIKGPLKNEVLRVRNKSGRFAKAKSDRDLLYFYYNTKTKRSRPIFKDKKGKPQPRRITARQLKFITAKRVSRFQSRKLRSITFTINSKSYVMHQVYARRKEIMGLIRPYLKKRSMVFLYTDIQTPDGALARSPMLSVGRNYDSTDTLNAIAVELILNQLQASNYRMSPKLENNRFQGKKHTRKATVTLSVAVL